MWFRLQMYRVRVFVVTRQVLAHVVSHCLPIRIHVQARFIVRVILAVQVEYRIIVYACLDIHKEVLDIICRSLMIYIAMQHTECHFFFVFNENEI